jgi:hypothetical protein
VFVALPLIHRRSRELLRRAWARKLACILGVIAITCIALLRAAPAMAPVQEGDPATFWLQACRIDVGVKRPGPLGGFYQPRDGWFIYYLQGFHGQFLYRVRAADSLRVFPRVARRLGDAPPGALDPDVEQAARAWLQADPGRTDAALLLVKLREARLARLQELDRGAYEYALAAESDFADRWVRSKRYPLNVALEWAFLTGLILFATWPWLRGAGYVRWAVHVGLAPILFFLPHWTGYAQLTFTSAGPTGGVLYPWLIVQFRGLPWTPLDTTIVRGLPQVLQPLSQTTGPMLSLSGGRGVGPVAATVMAGGLVLIIAATAVYRRSRAEVLRGGTPVLLAVGGRVIDYVRRWLHPRRTTQGDRHRGG